MSDLYLAQELEREVQKLCRPNHVGIYSDGTVNLDGYYSIDDLERIISVATLKQDHAPDTSSGSDGSTQPFDSQKD